MEWRFGVALWFGGVLTVFQSDWLKVICIFAFVFILGTMSPCTTGPKRYMTHLTVKVQSNSQIIYIPLTERKKLKVVL